MMTTTYVLLASIRIYAEPDIPLTDCKEFKQVWAKPLGSKKKKEELRAYHAKNDLMNLMFFFVAKDEDYDWQMESIAQHLNKITSNILKVYFKASWFGENKQWMFMNDLVIHDPFLWIRYDLKNTLIDKRGWECIKHYMEQDIDLNRMVKAYNVSKETKKIKFGIEVSYSTKANLALDTSNKYTKWKDAMKAEIDFKNEY